MTSPELNFFDDAFEHLNAPVSVPEVEPNPGQTQNYWRKVIQNDYFSHDQQLELFKSMVTEGVIANDTQFDEGLSDGGLTTDTSLGPDMFWVAALKDFGYKFNLVPYSQTNDNYFHVHDAEADHEAIEKILDKASNDKQSRLLYRATNGTHGLDTYLPESDWEGLSEEETARAWMTSLVGSTHIWFMSQADFEFGPHAGTLAKYEKYYLQGYRPYNFEQLYGMAYATVTKVLSANPEIAPAASAQITEKNDQEKNPS